ncbi:MAG TPA: tetratricopeptide repeat protein [Thermoanaerobaculia bacterium]|nr:tetratricopeptide repeat protein [Thermoanaerobaculia bacterium]
MQKVITWLALMASIGLPQGAAAAASTSSRATHPSASILHGTSPGVKKHERVSKSEEPEGIKEEKKEGREGKEGGDETEEKGQNEKKDKLEHAASDVSAIRSIAADTLLVAVLVSFMAALFLEMRRNSVIIDPIEVPKDLADNGYTPQVVAQRLAAEITALRREARMRGRLEEGYELSSAQTDFTVPAAGISYRSIIRYARQIFRRPEQLVQGEIVRDCQGAQETGAAESTAGSLYLVLRTRERHTFPKVEAAADRELPSLLKRAAFELAVIADPYLVMNYWFAVDQREGRFDFERTIAAARRCLTQTGANEHYRAYTTWGNALVVKRDIAAAEARLAAALRLAPRSAQAFNGLGNLKRVTRRYDHAAAMYRRAIAIDRRQGYVWSNLGNVENDRRKYGAAVRRFRRAIRLDPRFAAAWSGQGYALWKLGRSDDAEVAFSRAVDLDPNYGWSYLSWARLLQSQGRDEDAIAKARFMVEHKLLPAEGYGLWGDFLLKRGDLDKAEPMYQQAKEADPRNAGGLYGLAYLRLRQRRYEAAIELCEQALAVDRYHMNSLGTWADALRESRRHEEAVAKYQEILALDPYQTRAYNGLGHILRNRHRPKDAVASFERAAAIDSRDAWTWRSWGQALLDMHHYKAAAEKFHRAVAIDPRDASGHIFWAIALAALRQHEPALGHYRRACALDGRNAEGWRRLADLLINLGQRSEALSALAGAIATWPDEARLRLELGRALARLGRRNDAVRQLENAANASPRDAEVLRIWASALPSTAPGRDQAMRLLVRALVAEPWNEAVSHDLGLAFFNLGLPELASRWFANAQTHTPESAPILLGWSETLRRLARQQPASQEGERENLYAQAEEKLRQATELDPWNTGPWQNWAALLQERKLIDAALAKLERAIHIDSAGWGVWADRGDLLLRAGRLTKAIRAYRRAMAFCPGNPPLLANLAEALQRTGKRAEATALLERALKIDPHHPQASELLAKGAAASDLPEAAT